MADPEKPSAADRLEPHVRVPAQPDDRSTLLDRIPRPEDAPEEGTDAAAEPPADRDARDRKRKRTSSVTGTKTY